jgi:MFS family permease
MGGRFVLGFGNSLAQMASPLLLTEICHPQHRGPVTAIYNCLWNAGALLVSCIAWGTANIQNDWSWRSITLIQVVPSVIQLCGIWWIPESPRYLVNKERHQEALHILTKWHAGGDPHNATVQFEFREIRETIRIQKETERSTSYRDFLRTRGNRWRLAIIVSLGVISQYSGNALFSNYMNAIYIGAGIENQNQKLAMSTGKTILDLFVTIAAALNVDRYGRRPLFLISMVGMVMSFVCWTITGAVYENSGELNVGAGYAQLVFIWIFGVFYDIGFSGLLVAYALEILPFHLRAKGMMIMNITVQAMLAISKYVLCPLACFLWWHLLTNPSAKPTRSRGSGCRTTGTLCSSTRSGICASSYSCGSSTSRPRAPRSRRLRASLTAMVPSLTLTCTRCKRTSTPWRSAITTCCQGELSDSNCGLTLRVWSLALGLPKPWSSCYDTLICDTIHR